MTALHDIPDSVFRNDGLWRQWYDAEAPETANVPDYEDRLSKFERMCVVKVSHAARARCQLLCNSSNLDCIATLRIFAHLALLDEYVLGAYATV